MWPREVSGMGVVMGLTEDISDVVLRGVSPTVELMALHMALPTVAAGKAFSKEPARLVISHRAKRLS